MGETNGPWPLMALVGAVLGLALAVGEHFLIGWLRRVAPLPLAVVGWLAIAAAVVGMVTLVAGVVTGKDPTGISLVFVFVGLLLLAAVAGLATLHYKRDSVPYLLACGHLMAQFGGAVLLCYAIAQILPGLVALMHGAKPNDPRMIDWFPPVHLAADWMYGAFLVGVVLLEAFRPLRHFLAKGG